MRLKLAGVLIVTGMVLFTRPGYSIGYNIQIDTTGFGKSIDLIMRRAYKLRFVKLDSALRTCDSAEVKIKVLKDERRRATFCAVKGAVLLNNGREAESIVLLKEAWSLALAQDRKVLQQKITNLFLCCYMFMGDYDLALEYGLKLLNLATATNDEEDIVIANVNLGLLYYKLYDSRMALKYYSTALGIIKEPIPDIYINIGLCYHQLEQYDSAFFNFKKALHDVRVDPGDGVMASYHFGMAATLKSIKNYDSAFYHNYRGLAIAKRQGDHRFTAEFYRALAEVFLDKEQFPQALHYLAVCEELCISNSLYAILKDVYLNFSDLYIRRHDYVSASFYKEKYLQTWQRLVGEDVLNRLALIEIDFAERENMLKVAEGRQVMQWKDQRISNREVIIWLIISASVLLVVVLGALLRISRVARSVNTKLESEVKIETVHVEDSLLDAVQERNAWNKSVEGITREVRKLLATTRGYHHVLMNNGAVAGMETKFLEDLRHLEDSLRGFQK